MIQFNLLPDVKLAFMRAERQRRLVLTISILASSIALGLFLVLFLYVNVVQHKSVNDLTSDISAASKDLMSTKDLNKILTVQNQLGSLDELHDQKPISSRLFGFLQQVTPSDVTITQLNVDFTQNTMSITGKAPELVSVNTYIDSLKFTTFVAKDVDGNVVNDPAEGAPAFSDVVLSQFGRSDQGATYTITLNFDAEIFIEANTVELTVPQKITTRSNLERPSALFEESQDTQGQ